MPRFKSAENIFGIHEYFESKWFETDELVLPPTQDWDYSRELQISDVDIWEVLYEKTGGYGVFASWCPYAEFYLIRLGWENEKKGNGWETYYGPGAQQIVFKRAQELGIQLFPQQVWIDPKDMWLYQLPEIKKIISI
jgi:hypothetical protein